MAENESLDRLWSYSDHIRIGIDHQSIVLTRIGFVLISN